MSLVDLLLLILVAIACGTFAQLTSGYSRGGWIVNLGIGFLGALAGVFIARSFAMPKIYDVKVRAVDFPIIYAIIGSVLLLAAIGFFIKPGRR